MALPTTIQLLSESIANLHAGLYGPQLISTQYSDEFNKSYGDTIKVPVAPIYVANDFVASVTDQPAYEDTIEVKLNKFKDVTISVGAQDKKLSAFDFGKKHMGPAMTAMSQAIEADIWVKSKEVYNYVDGVVGAPDTFYDLSKIESYMSSKGCPKGQIKALVDYATYSSMIGNIEEIRTAEKRGDGGAAIASASIGSVAGIDFYRSTYLPKKAVELAGNGLGTSTNLAANLVKGATTVTLADFDLNDIVSDGDIIEFVDFVNNNTVVGYAVVTLPDGILGHDLTVNGATVTIRPCDFDIASAAGSISAKYHNISYNIVFHPTAISFASVTLDEPEDATDSAVVVDPETNIALRLVAGVYDLITKKTRWSLDCLYGVNLTRPSLIARFDGVRV